jgi:hypothetical protein
MSDEVVKTKKTSQPKTMTCKPKYRQATKPLQADHRARKIIRARKAVEKKFFRAAAVGDQPAQQRLQRQIDAMDLALSYKREEGKKGPKGIPLDLHDKIQTKPKNKGVRVWYGTAAALKVPHGGYVTLKQFTEYCNKEDAASKPKPKAEEPQLATVES